MPLETASPDTVLDSADDQEVVRYRAVCGVAMGACLLGLASAVALIMPLFWFVPALAAVLALFALARIRAYSAELTGRGLAITGLCLAVLFGVWAPTRYWSRQQVMFRHGEAFAQEWFELVRSGKRLEAYEMHLAPRSRQPANVSLARYYENSTDPKKALEAFYAASPVRELAAAGPKAEISLTQAVAVATDDEISTAQVVILDYEARYPGLAGETVQPLRVFLRRRKPEADGAAQWEMLSVIDPTKKSGS